MFGRLASGALLSTALAATSMAAAAPAPEPRPSPAPASLAGGAKAAPAASATGERGIMVYRIETSRETAIWAADHPMQAGEVVSFHEYPSGTLVSMRRSEIRRVVAQRVDTAHRGPKPGEAIDIGVTGGGSASRTAAGGGASRAPGAAPSPGERKDGTALFNPDRKYQPDIDSKQVPGMNTGYPNSPNDYREGRTLGYPAAPAVQSAPGDPPKMPDSGPH